MNISRFAAKRPVTILMVIFIVLLLGMVSLKSIGIDLFPEMNLPVAVVITSYEGCGPEEMETQVTKPIEEAIASVDNIENITSETREGLSMVVAEFSWGTDMDFATLKMRENIAMWRSVLPDDIQDPLVYQFDPSMMPILIMTFSGPQGQEELKDYAEDIIKPRLERIEGIASVYVSGGRDREIKVNLNMTKLDGYGITADTVASALAGQNLNSPVGTIDQAGYEYLLRTMGEFQSVEDIKNILIPLPKGGSIRLKEIATVADDYADITQYNYMNGQPTIAITVQKQSGANTVKVASEVLGEVEKLQKVLPKNSEIVPIMDQSKFIKRSINNVTRNAVIGAVLAILIIYFFLRNLSSTFIIGTAIPISVVATFILVYFGGLTLNLMSLGGLALGVGMLVDNAIVVLENIYRHRQHGKDKFNSSVDGASEVANAITASTLTTLAVFLPIVYVEGLASQLFRELAMTVAFSLLASLAVSLTLIPMLSSKFMRTVNGNNGNANKTGVKKNLLRKFKGIQEGLVHTYIKILSWTLRHRIKTVALALVCFAGSLMLIPFIGAEFIPDMDQGEFQITVELPKGTALEETKTMIQKLESYITEFDEVEYLYIVAGGTSQDLQMDTEGQSHTGEIFVSLCDAKDRNITTEEMVEHLRQQFKDIPGVKTEIDISNGFSMAGSSSPVSIKIKGDDLDVLKDLGSNISSIVKSVKGTREVSFSLEEGRPEMRMVIDRDKASSYGLTSAQIASAVRAAITGQVATLYRADGDEINIRIEAMERYKDNFENVRTLKITSPLGIKVPLSQLVDFQIVKGPTKITRDNQERTATVTADIAGRDLGSVIQDITNKMRDVAVPDGYSIEFGGEQKDMQEAFSDLSLALLLAIALVYMIMAAQFESLIHPFIIMFSMPFALVGAVLGLIITGRTFNVPAFIGLIMLAGIVVNNAIVMVDYINQLRKSGKGREEAIVEAGSIRLRPIFMTAMTTILAMLPIAVGIGEGAESQAPLATVVVGGLTVSTLLTLVIVPVAYTLTDDAKNLFARKLNRRRKSSIEI